MRLFRKSNRHTNGIQGSYRRDIGLATERYVRLDSHGRIVEPRSQQRSKGQALLIVALMMTVLVLFVGLGVDVGNLMGKRSKLQSAVDAAALSAAQLMSNPQVQSSLVVTKAYQMLETNGVPSSTLRLGHPQVTVNLVTFQVRVQAVQRVDTFFMRLIPLWKQVEVSADATADLNAYAEINTKPYGIQGVVNELNLMVWGPYSWRRGGDAYSPQYEDYPAVVNSPEHAQMPYGYLYRIDIPTDYADNHLLVQIFDADSYNRPDLPPTPVTPVATPTQCPPLPYICPPIPTKVPTGTPYAEAAQFTYCGPVTTNCSTGDARYNTGLKLGAYPVATVSGPPRPSFWRVDETRTLYSTCTGSPCTIGNAYADNLTTQTQYTLWHFDPHITSAFADPSTLSDLAGGAYIARYPGRLETSTDLAWVTPTGFDIKLSDPTDSNCNFDPPNHDCYPRESNGKMYFYLYVQSLDGSSENNFDLRVGPASDNDACPPSSPCKVNQKYFDQMNDPTIPDWDTGRAFIFAKRALPLNLDSGAQFPMLFTQVSKNAAGQTLAIRHFDQDCNLGCGYQMQYQMQLCQNDGAGNYTPCADTLNDNCFGNVGVGYVGPNNDWYCSGCPAPEKVTIPVEGDANYTQFFGPSGQCASSWLRLKSNPSYSQDTTVWEMPFARPRLIK